MSLGPLAIVSVFAGHLKFASERLIAPKASAGLDVNSKKVHR